MGNFPRMAEVTEKCQEREFLQIIMRKVSKKRWSLSQGQPPAKKQRKSETLLSLSINHGSKFSKKHLNMPFPPTRYNICESTIRMWLKKADWLDYRGPSYRAPPHQKIRFQGTLQDFLDTTPEEIKIDDGSGKQSKELNGPLKPYHAEFLQQLMLEYSGVKLTKVKFWTR